MLVGKNKNTQNFQSRIDAVLPFKVGVTSGICFYIDNFIESTPSTYTLAAFDKLSYYQTRSLLNCPHSSNLPTSRKLHAAQQ